MASRSARKATRASSAGTASASTVTGPSTRMSRQTRTSPARPARSKTRRLSSPLRTCSIVSSCSLRGGALALEQLVALGGHLAAEHLAGRLRSPEDLEGKPAHRVLQRAEAVLLAAPDIADHPRDLVGVLLHVLGRRLRARGGRRDCEHDQRQGCGQRRPHGCRGLTRVSGMAPSSSPFITGCWLPPTARDFCVTCCS